MVITSDGVVYMLADPDPSEEDTRPYSLQTIAERVADGEAFAEVWYAYQHDMRTRPTVPIGRDTIEALRKLDEEQGEDRTPVMWRR